MTLRSKLSYALLFLLFTACVKVNHLAKVEPQTYKLNDESIEADAQIAAMIQPYKVQLDKEMNEVVGTCAQDMKKAKPESLLGNWMADLLLEESMGYYNKPIDFAIINYGGIRIPALPKGEITRGKLFELMPFDNKVVVLKVKGVILAQLFDLMASHGGWPISHTVSYQIQNEKASDIKIAGQALDLERTYSLALSDFVANGGDRCFFFKDQPRDALNVLLRDMIIEYVRKQNEKGALLDAKLTGRTVKNQ